MAESSPRDCGFDPRCDDERKSAFVVERHFSVFHAQRFKKLFGLLPDRAAIISKNSRFQFDGDAAALARFNPDLNIGTNIRAAMPVTAANFIALSISESMNF
jgi:hypothetical protein